MAFGKPEGAGRHHAMRTIDLLRDRSTLVDNAVRRGAVSTVAAQYCLGTGRVTEVEPALAAA
jgi:carbonic anhydrase